MKSRLDAFEEMLSDVLHKYSDTSEKLNILKAEGKPKQPPFVSFLVTN